MAVPVHKKNLHMNIIQWNARGVLGKNSELKASLSEKSIKIIGITETHLNPRNSVRYSGYHIIRKDRMENNYGGLMMLIHKSVKYKECVYASRPGDELEVMLIKIEYGGQWASLALIYNPCKNIRTDEIERLAAEAGNCGVIFGDFNAHHELWEPNQSRRNTTGNNLFDFLTGSPAYTLLNPPNLPTRLDPHTGKTSNIDLFIATIHFQHFNVTVGADMGSDHVPIEMSIQTDTQEKQLFRERWNFKQPNWDSWTSTMSKKSIERCDTTQQAYESFNRAIITHSEGFFQRGNSAKPRLPGAPWWSDECKDAVEERRIARHDFARRPTPKNKKIFNKSTNKAADVIKEAKKDSWNKFVTAIDHRTPNGVIWKMYRAVIGRDPPCAYPIEAANIPLSNEDSSNALAQHFRETFAGDHNLRREEEQLLERSYESGDESEINQRFSLEELRKALGSLTPNTAPGKDLLHNQFLIHLPKNHHGALLAIFNQSFRSGEIPAEWKSSLILPIPKPGKDHSQVSSYRPISLLSCVGKLMERLINNRVTWYLGKNSIYSPQQYGFLPKSSTSDPLALMEHDIQMSFRTGGIVLAVFFDLKAAFDKATHGGILYKLARAGLQGRIMRWLRCFLEDRTFEVAVGSSVSEKHTAASGVPQGSICSPTLFNVLLSDLPTNRGVETLIYADDITMYVSNKDPAEAQVQLQEAVDDFVTWTKRWNLIINRQKTFCSYYTRKTSVRNCPQITVEGDVIPYTNKQKLLGVILDSPRLTWRPQIEDLRVRCQKRLDILRAVSGTSFGGSRETLQMLYGAHIRSLVDYSLPLISSAAPYLLKKLDVIHSTGMRLVTGAWRSTPLKALFCEAGTLPPDLHREERCVKLFTSLRCRDYNHPIHAKYHQDDFLTSIPFEKNHNKTPLIYRASRVLQFYGIAVPPPTPTPAFSCLPPWFPLESLLVTDWCGQMEDVEGGKRVAFQYYLEEKYSGYLHLYTDGSFIRDVQPKIGVGLAVPAHGCEQRWKLNHCHSILAAELFGILQALQYVINHRSQKAIILTDSLTSLHLISKIKTSNCSQLVQTIHRNIWMLKERILVLHWIPSHAGIPGNETADKLAKSAARSALPVTEIPVDRGDFLRGVAQHIWSHWQARWDSARGQHHLGALKSSVRPWKTPHQQTRKYDCIFTKLRLGKASLNKYLFKINRAETPQCEFCGDDETVHHFLIQCPHYSNARTVLRQKLSRININYLSPSLLLGGDACPSNQQKYVLHATEQFVKATERFDS